MNGVWQRAGDRIRESLGQVGYETWIGPLNFVGLHERKVTIEAPNRFFRDWVSDRYLELMRQVLSDELGEMVEVKLILGKQTIGNKPFDGNLNGNGHAHQEVATRSSPVLNQDSGATPRAAAHPQLNPRYTFAEFVVGSSNQFAHAAALAVATRRKLIDQVIADKMMICGAHFPFPGAGAFAKDGDAYSFMPVVHS